MKSSSSVGDANQKKKKDKKANSANSNWATPSSSKKKRMEICMPSETPSPGAYAN